MIESTQITEPIVIRDRPVRFDPFVWENANYILLTCMNTMYLINIFQIDKHVELIQITDLDLINNKKNKPGLLFDFDDDPDYLSFVKARCLFGIKMISFLTNEGHVQFIEKQIGQWKTVTLYKNELNSKINDYEIIHLNSSTCFLIEVCENGTLVIKSILSSGYICKQLRKIKISEFRLSRVDACCSGDAIFANVLITVNISEEFTLKLYMLEISKGEIVSINELATNFSPMDVPLMVYCMKTKIIEKAKRSIKYIVAYSLPYHIFVGYIEYLPSSKKLTKSLETLYRMKDNITTSLEIEKDRISYCTNMGTLGILLFEIKRNCISITHDPNEEALCELKRTIKRGYKRKNVAVETTTLPPEEQVDMDTNKKFVTRYHGIKKSKNAQVMVVLYLYDGLLKETLFESQNLTYIQIFQLKNEESCNIVDYLGEKACSENDEHLEYVLPDILYNFSLNNSIDTIQTSMLNIFQRFLSPEKISIKHATTAIYIYYWINNYHKIIQDSIVELVFRAYTYLVSENIKILSKISNDKSLDTQLKLHIKKLSASKNNEVLETCHLCSSEILMHNTKYAKCSEDHLFYRCGITLMVINNNENYTKCYNCSTLYKTSGYIEALAEYYDLSRCFYCTCTLIDK